MADDLYQAAGVSPAQAPPPGLDLYQAMNSTAVSPGQDNKTNWLEDFLHQATGGLSDKAEAALKASGAVSGGTPGTDFSDRYHKDLTNTRGAFGDYEAANPGYEGAKSAHAAAVVAPMLLAAPEAGATTMGEAALRGGLTGAGVGGAYGFGNTNDESVGKDLLATGAGAVAGVAAGAAAPVAAGIAKVPFKMARRAASVFGDEGAETAAGRVLNQAKTNGNTFEQAPLPDMKLTTGQSTNDQGLLWLERNVSQATPEGATKFAESAASNNGAIRGAVSQLGDTGNDAAKGMSDALDSAYAKRRAVNQAVWKRADVSNPTGISGADFQKNLSSYIAGLPVADQSVIPGNVTSLIDKVGKANTQSLSDIQAVRSMIGGTASQVARSGDKNTARVLSGLGDQVDNFINDKATMLGSQLPLYREAIADTKDMKQTFSQPPAVRAALGTDAFGADKVSVSATADHFINSGKGAKETFNSYLNAISNKDPQTGKVTYDPAGLKAAQDAFSQKFLGQVSNAGVDANGQNLVSPAKMQKFLGDYQHVINSPMFTQPQRDMVGQIAKATQMASRTANAKPPGGGSDTFQKLQGDKFIDALVGPGASKLVGAAGKIGGAAMGYLEDGKLGAGLGFMAGEKGADLVNSLYKAPRDKVVSIVTEAMHDPQLAKDLMMKASNTNAKLLPPPRRAKLLGVVGGQAGASVANALTSQN